MRQYLEKLSFHLSFFRCRWEGNVANDVLLANRNFSCAEIILTKLPDLPLWVFSKIIDKTSPCLLWAIFLSLSLIQKRIFSQNLECDSRYYVSFLFKLLRSVTFKWTQETFWRIADTSRLSILSRREEKASEYAKNF